MAISTMDSARGSNKKDDFIPEAKYREPMHILLNAMHDKLDELIGKINTIDAATNTNTAKTGITTGQASAITANTSKVSMTLGTSGSTALAGDTKIVDYVGSSDTNITIGNMASATVKGQTVYTLPITVTQSGTDKNGNPTTLTKTATLTLA